MHGKRPPLIDAGRTETWYTCNMKTVQRAPKSSGKSFTIGRRAFAKISEIEGVRLSDDMNEDFQEFERKELSPQDRRQAISRKYAKAR